MEYDEPLTGRELGACLASMLNTVRARIEDPGRIDEEEIRTYLSPALHELTAAYDARMVGGSVASREAVALVPLIQGDIDEYPGTGSS